MKEKSTLERVLFSIFLFATLGGLYIVANSYFHPATLPTTLTHLTFGLREDTFGIMCWIISFITFTWWNIIRD